jgi:protein ImuA
MQYAGNDILFQLKQDQFDRLQPNRGLYDHFQSNEEFSDQPDQNLPDQFQSNHDLLDQKKQILQKLKKEILLQRFGNLKNHPLAAASLYPFANAFPFHQFPLGCIHEFICPTNESFSASSAFVCGILSSLKQNKGTIIWISSSQKMFPPSFPTFGIAPHNIIFINTDKPKHILYTTEEALRCKDISAVITDIRELSFKQSRRLQLATEQSRVTGFILRNKPKSINITACVSRWVITPTISTSYQNLPGICFPSWNVDLQKVRNGKPQSWKITWLGGHFVHEQDLTTFIIHHKKAV